MRTYIIILSDIPSKAADLKFATYVENNKFEFWRYTPLNWILLTPDTVSTNMINAAVVEAYGPIFSCSLEVKINDFAGIMPTKKEINEAMNPFRWFRAIKEPAFIPRWEKEKEKTK